MEFRENRSRFRRTFLKSYCRDTIKFTCFVGESSLEMIAEIMDGVICLSFYRDSVLSEKSGKNSPDESRGELEKNL